MKGFSGATFLVGLALTVAAFVGFLALGSVFNPAPYRVMVVTKDMAPGDKLNEADLAVSAQRISTRVVQGYVLENEIADYVGATVVEPMHPGDPLTKARLVKRDNPAAMQYASRGLEDPLRVLMVIPVGDSTAPSNISPQDRIDVIFSVGQPPPDLGPLPTPSQSFGQVVAGETAGIQPPQPAESPTVTPTLNAEPVQPLAKVLFNSLQVYRVTREQKPNPAYSGQDGQDPFIEGNIVALEVLVPREQEELLQWAISTGGKVYISLVSPNAPPDESAASVLTPGMTWDDLIAFFRAQRLEYLQSVATGAGSAPAGAAGYGILEQATAQATTMRAQNLAAVPPLVPTGALPATLPASKSTPLPVTPTLLSTKTAATPAPTHTFSSTPEAATATSAPVTAAATRGVASPPSGALLTQPQSSGVTQAVSLMCCGSFLLIFLALGAMFYRKRRLQVANE